MSNHVHLLLTPRRAESVPRLVMSLGRRYVQYINRTHARADEHLVGQPLEGFGHPGRDLSADLPTVH